MIEGRRESLVLLFGDILVFYAALWLMLFFRYGALPSEELFSLHAVPFSILFLVWILIFYIAGLYEKHTLVLKKRIGPTVLKAQIFNTALAFFFFYLIPYFGITPKTNLFIYLVVSFLLLVFWRSFLFSGFEVRKKQNAILVGEGEEMKELEAEVNNNQRYNLYFVSSVDLNETSNLDFQEEIVKRIYSENIGVVAADFKNEKVEPVLPKLYNLIFSKVKFIDMHKVYEDIFDRIPLSLVKYSWFLENISGAASKGYDLFKRLMDLILAFLLGAVSLVFYPFAFVAIKLEDGGPVFFTQERIGQNNKIFKVVKFRSLKVHNNPDGIAKSPEPTRIGRILRNTRIDELPQLWSVVRGDLSMIGPRPEIPSLVKLYEKEIPYYNVRHLIKPGLSGWAQLYHQRHPHHAPDSEETKVKLSYDLYYIKNRSLMLDIKIALRTLQVLLSRVGA